MALAIRMIPNAGHSVLYANGRAYQVSGAAYVDVPYGDALQIQSDQAYRLLMIGTTADRLTINPSNQPYPRVMYDTTLGKPMFYQPNTNPPVWTDITGVAG